MEARAGRGRVLEGGRSESIRTPASHAGSALETVTSCLSETMYIHRETRKADEPQAVASSVTHKTRRFGQSHWINSVILVRSGHALYRAPS